MRVRALSGLQIDKQGGTAVDERERDRWSGKTTNEPWDYLDEIERCLLECDEGIGKETDLDPVGEILDRYHTMKGKLQTRELSCLTKITKKLEDLCKFLLLPHIQLNQDQIDFLMQCIDVPEGAVSSYFPDEQDVLALMNMCR